MPQIAILFYGDAVTAATPEAVAPEPIACLRSAVPPLGLRNCRIGHGRTESGAYCLVVEHASEEALWGIRHGLEAASSPPLLPASERFLAEPRQHLENYYPDYLLDDDGRPDKARRADYLGVWDADGSAGSPAGAPSQETAPPALPLPREIPEVLSAPESGQRRAAGISGTLIGLALSLLLGSLTPAASSIHQVFDPGKPGSAVPVAISCLFFWGLMLCRLRRRRLVAVESLNKPNLLTAVMRVLQTHGVAGLAAVLQTPVAAYSPLARRARAAIEQWSLRPSLQNATLALDQLSASDSEAVHRGYNLIRLFVWATPVLGLIGTVVGISAAVGSFAQFLGGNIDDVAVIKTNLVNVTGGLSFAFLITLEGLLASLILMLAASGLQTREGRLYSKVEQDISERFLPALQAAAPERDMGGWSVSAGGWEDAMQAAAKRVLDAVNQYAARLLDGLDRRVEAYVAQLGDAAKTFREAGRDVVTALEKAAVNVAEQIAGPARSVAQTAEGVNRAVTAAAGEIERALQAHAGELRTACQNTAELTRIARQSIESQATLRKDVALLGENGLVGALNGLESSLNKLGPVLAGFREPFVLQAVPVAAKAKGA